MHNELCASLLIVLASPQLEPQHGFEVIIGVLAFAELLQQIYGLPPQYYCLGGFMQMSGLT